MLRGEQHRDTAISYSDLANDLYAQGQYSAAARMHRHALDIRLKVLGEWHADTVESYNNLAAVLNILGQYAEAEKLLRKALAIHLKVHGQGHAATATAYNNLAVTLVCQCLYSEAEKLHRQALAIVIKLRGEQHTDTADCYSSLAGGLGAAGHYAEAEQLLRKALDICLKVHGERHLATAHNYHNLGAALGKQGQYTEAAKMAQLALDIFVHLGGEHHPGALSSANVLMLALYERGRYAEAEKLARQTLDSQRQVLGEQHPDTVLSYNNLALVLYYRGDYAAAEGFALAAARSFQAARLAVSFTGLGRSGFAARRSQLLFLAALLARNGKAAAAWQSWEDDLGRGLFDDLSARASRLWTAEERQQHETLLSRLALLENRLALLLPAKPAKTEQVAELRKELEQLMSQLVDFQAALEKKHGVIAGEVYDLKRIQAQLAPDAALLGWLDLPGRTKAKDPNGEHWAVLLRQQGTPVWVKLTGTGPDGQWTKEDTRLAEQVRRQLHVFDANVDWKDLVKELARQRLQPLAKYLEGVRHLIVLPSDEMAGIPIEILTDRYLVSYAPSATLYAWLQERRQAFAAPGELLALGDPAFTAEQFNNAAQFKADPASNTRGANLKALPGTRAEVQAIAQLFQAQGGKVKLLLGTVATARNLDELATQKELKRFRYLHLATHGFADARGGLNSYLALTSEDFALVSHDKLTAGHMLRTWKLEADLVVLSACQTGLGQHQGGEGYVGFAQALFLAGAHSLVLSQWPVDDRATALLMQRFYQNLLGARPGLKEPLPKLAALTEARQWLRGLSRKEAVAGLTALGLAVQPKELPGERPFAHPHFWAAFILIGDPGQASEPAKK
jgi:CHAT domain-containing protein